MPGKYYLIKKPPEMSGGFFVTRNLSLLFDDVFDYIIAEGKYHQADQ